MDSELFSQLLQRPESQTLDFKQDLYNFEGTTKEEKENRLSKFIKDIISFANTKRTKTSYIICGVKEQYGKKVLHGITSQIDDAELQQKVKDRVYPVPQFIYYPFEYNGKQFGIIEIPVYRYLEPCKVCKKMKGLELDTVYLRRGSSNSKATEHEIVQIYNWLESPILQESISSIPPSLSQSQDNNTNPYKTLQPYSENDKHLFFGRNKEIKTLIERIRKNRIVCLFGESGTGKTSLINAGLIPVLKEDGFLVISERCLNEPTQRIKKAVASTIQKNKILAQYSLDLMATSSFREFIQELQRAVEQQEQQLIIIVDQFEELFEFTSGQEQDQVIKGIDEILTCATNKGNILFLFSLREDYLGRLWDLSNEHEINVMWINTYRIHRLDRNNASEAISKPINKIGFQISDNFVNQLVSDLEKLGNGSIYPPYLQIVCSLLFEEFKRNECKKKFATLYRQLGEAEAIIAEYLIQLVPRELSKEKRIRAQHFLNLFPGSEGVRRQLTITQISKELQIEEEEVRFLIKHFTNKKIIHAVMEEERVIGYELVHDFLSKKLFEQFSPDVKRIRTIQEIYQKAFADWKQHGVLASKDRLEIFRQNIDCLRLDNEGKLFFIKSGFSNIAWFEDDNWLEIIEDDDRKIEICMDLLNDTNEQVVENAIHLLGEMKAQKAISRLKEIIGSPQRSFTARDAAITEFDLNLNDRSILPALKNIIENEKDFRLRRAAVSAFADNIEIEKVGIDLQQEHIPTLYEALEDAKYEVRKEAAKHLGFLENDIAINALIERLEKEQSIPVRRAIISSLGSLAVKSAQEERVKNLLLEILQKSEEDEDYRIREEARINWNWLITYDDVDENNVSN